MATKKTFAWHNTRGRYQSTISQYEDEYFLGNDGFLHLKPAQKDLQAAIDSYKETALERILAQMSEPAAISFNESDDYVLENESAKSDLEALLEADRIFDDIRAEYPELSGANKTKVIDYIRSKAETNYKDWRIKQDEKKKETQQKSEQTELPQNSAESKQA